MTVKDERTRRLRIHKSFQEAIPVIKPSRQIPSYILAIMYFICILLCQMLHRYGIWIIPGTSHIQLIVYLRIVQIM